MKDKKELLSEMEKAMDRYDLSKEIEKAYIGEWIYGVAMVPCDWVYKYVAQPEVVKCKDCKHCYYASNRVPDERSFVCEKHGIDITVDWFCADGEKKQTEQGVIL